MDIFPALHFLKVFSQPWEGDVTMVLPSSFMQIKKSITNPSQEDLREACQQVTECTAYGRIFGERIARKLVVRKPASICALRSRASA